MNIMTIHCRHRQQSKMVQKTGVDSLFSATTTQQKLHIQIK